jgi:hypothetical protein
MTDYYIHGVDKLSPRVRRHVCVAAVATYVAEGVISAMQEDGRLARAGAEVEAVAAEEARFISSLEMLTWERLASVVQDPEYGAVSARADVLHSVHVQRAFLEKRIFSVARGRPWNLAVGNIEANLRSFAASDETDLDEKCSGKIKKLLRVGWSLPALASAVNLLLDVGSRGRGATSSSD